MGIDGGGNCELRVTSYELRVTSWIFSTINTFDHCVNLMLRNLKFDCCANSRFDPCWNLMAEAIANLMLRNLEFDAAQFRIWSLREFDERIKKRCCPTKSTFKFYPIRLPSIY